MKGLGLCLSVLSLPKISFRFIMVVCCGCSTVAVRVLPKHKMGVQFSSPAWNVSRVAFLILGKVEPVPL